MMSDPEWMMSPIMHICLMLVLCVASGLLGSILAPPVKGLKLASGPTDGLNPKVCETCYECGKRAGAKETEAKNSGLAECIKQLESMVAQRDADVRNVTEDWRKDINQVCNKLEERGKANETLETIVFERNEMILDLGAQLAKCRATIDEKCNQVALITLGNQEAELAIQDLEKTVAGRDSEIRSWIATLNERDERIKRGKEANERQIDLLSEAGAEAAAARLTIAGLHAEHARLSTGFDAKCDQVAERDRTIESLHKDCSDSSALAELYGKNVDDLLDQLAKANRMNQSVENQFSGVIADRDATIKKLREEIEEGHAKAYVKGVSATVRRVRSVLPIDGAIYQESSVAMRS